MRRADTHGRSRLAHDVGHSVRFRAPSSFGRSETSPGYDPDVPQAAIVLTTVKTKPAAARRGPVLTAAARDGGHVVQAGTRRCLGRTRRCDERKYQEAPGRRPILGGLTRPRIAPLRQPASAGGKRQITTRACVRSTRGWRVRGSLCSGNRPANKMKQAATRDRWRLAAEQECARSAERAGLLQAPVSVAAPTFVTYPRGAISGSREPSRPRKPRVVSAMRRRSRLPPHGGGTAFSGSVHLCSRALPLRRVASIDERRCGQPVRRVAHGAHQQEQPTPAKITRLIV